MRQGLQIQRRRPALAALALGLAALAVPALASRPVARTIEGCVEGRAFVSQAGHLIRVRRDDDRRPVDLRRYEGLRLRFSGLLLPGDVFYIKSPPVVLGACRRPARRPGHRQ